MLISLFPIQLRHGDNLAVLVITIFELIYAFGILFVACEVCQRTNLAFDGCSEMLEQLEWYSFPIGIQRMLPIVLNVMHRPFEIKYFGGATCDREAFKYVR